MNLCCREEEGIELQVLSGKRISGSPPMAGSLASYSDVGAVGGTDADSIDSAEFHKQGDPLSELKPTSTIGLCYLKLLLYLFKKKHIL